MSIRITPNTAQYEPRLSMTNFLLEFLRCGTQASGMEGLPVHGTKFRERAYLLGRSYGTTLVAVPENPLSIPEVLNDVATNSYVPGARFSTR